jgi:uncharacterized protein YjbI with pentapeptide repeats
MSNVRAHVLIEHAEYREQRTVANVLEDNIFRYCTFSGFSFEGGHIDGVFLGCTFCELDWYWGLFNCCVFVETHFTKCIFRGTSFSNCKFVDCEFVDCQFLPDNLGQACSADGSRMYGGTTKNCEGEALLLNAVAL